jgi:hypothetical protein
VGADGLAAPAGRLADLEMEVGLANVPREDSGKRDEKLAILYSGTEPYVRATKPRMMLTV